MTDDHGSGPGTGEQSASEIRQIGTGESTVAYRATLLEQALDKAVAIPSAVIHAHVEQVRKNNPGADPARIIYLLEREYMLVIQGAGGAVGAAAAAPAIGTGVALALTAGDVATFFGASAAFSLAVASVHGIEVEDSARRRALLMATILGESGAKAVEDAAELSSVHVARVLLTRMPTGTLRKVNATLTKRMVRTQALRQGGIALGRIIPFGIGIAVGVAGARSLGHTVLEGARMAFGPPPPRFVPIVEVLETGARPRLVAVPDPVDEPPVVRRTMRQRITRRPR